MNSKKSLIYGQALIFLIIFVSIGVIIINEKGQFLFSKKINEKIKDKIKLDFNIKIDEQVYDTDIELLFTIKESDKL